MVVATEKRTHIYRGNGVNTQWPVQFLFYLPEHLEVHERQVGAPDWVRVSPGRYDVTGAGTNAGRITYPIAGPPIPANREIRIRRRVPFIQTGVDLNPASAFDPESVEREFDLAVMRDQQLAEMSFLEEAPELSNLLYPGAERLIRSVTLIPGATPFGYGTTPIYSSDDGGITYTIPENAIADGVTADLVLSIQQLKDTFPLCEQVVLVVSWFGDDLRAGDCRIRPMRESTGKLTAPRTWVSGGVPYASAPVIPNIDGGPIYGSSPDDVSVVECIQYLKQQGYKVILYPFVMMTVVAGNGLPDPYGGPEQAPLPWRGRITVMPTDQNTAAARSAVTTFFERTEGYEAFILHLADLAQQAGGVHGFVVGTEFPGLTTVRDNTGAFPAVEKFTALVETIRNLGVSQNVGYAADWTEYHPRFFGPDFLYHMDPLWAVCDFVGIDYYMPLSDWRNGVDHIDYVKGWGGPHSHDYIKSNVEGGELYDWFYDSPADRLAQVRTPITDGAYNTPQEFRIKDLRWWWNNQHYNRINGVRETTPTEWVARSIPIWLTEFGVSSADKGANQPNVFYTNKDSSENNFPYFSSGQPDFYGQRVALEAFIDYWRQNPEISGAVSMLDPANISVWTWDARPWPTFPERVDYWRDGEDWRLGHWITGKYDPKLRLGVQYRPQQDYEMQTSRSLLIDVSTRGTTQLTQLEIPEGALVVGVFWRVLSPIDATFDVGDDGDGFSVLPDPVRYGQAQSGALDARGGSYGTPFPIRAPLPLRLTYSTAATQGRLRIRVIYLTPPV